LIARSLPLISGVGAAISEDEPSGPGQKHG